MQGQHNTRPASPYLLALSQHKKQQKNALFIWSISFNL